MPAAFPIGHLINLLNLINLINLLILINASSLSREIRLPSIERAAPAPVSLPAKTRAIKERASDTVRQEATVKRQRRLYDNVCRLYAFCIGFSLLSQNGVHCRIR